MITGESPTPDQIRAARQAADLTQSQAAALVHTSLRSWQQWEAGDRRMHPAFWELFRRKAALDELTKQAQKLDMGY